MDKDYFDIKNEYFYQVLDELFNIKKAKTWDEIAQSVTLYKIKRTYRIFAELFPRNMNYLTQLEKSKAEFTTIHYGQIKAHKIIDEVVRFSLYSDKIIVFHPLQNPSVTNQKIDPRRNPKYWLPDFLDSLYFYIVIRKWVTAGIVKLIINPYEYDFGLRNQIDEQVEKRKAVSDIAKIFEVGKDSAMENLAEQFSRVYKDKNKTYIVSSLLKMQQPTFTQLNAEEFAEKIIEGFPKTNPLYNKLNILLNEKMLAPTKGGGPLESILLVSKYTDGNIYTTSNMNWYQIKAFGLNDFWIKANRLYSKIPLNFLNNVDTNFALNLRKEDRLVGVRTQLKKIYTELNDTNVSELTDSKMRDLHGEFKEEIKMAEAEWKEIRKQAEISRKYWIAANIGVPLVTNEISFLPLAIGSAIWLYSNERSTSEKMKLQRQKNPVSVFVDLKNQKQGFFSIFKNCLL